jgi:hypothetical protein
VELDWKSEYWKLLMYTVCHGSKDAEWQRGLLWSTLPNVILPWSEVKAPFMVKMKEYKLVPMDSMSSTS